MPRHLLGIRPLDKDQIVELISIAADFKLRIIERRPVPRLSDKVVGMLFFEHSTRTRVSFEQAAHYLGIKTASFVASSSSMNKGETLKDTIMTLRYERLDGLVMRHRASGSPTLAARFFGGPVVNAGDGEHEHPTQALGDALTILERKESIEGLKVAIVGDVKHSRVARSNAWLLSKLGADVRFVGPRTLIPQHTALLPGKVFYDLEAGIDDVDVIITLRLQKERMQQGMLSSVGEYSSMYQINGSNIRLAKPDCLVMHPGPINRGVELDDDAADGENSAIRAQIENGIFVRMASLYWAFGNGEPEPSKKSKKKSAK